MIFNIKAFKYLRYKKVFLIKIEKQWMIFTEAQRDINFGRFTNNSIYNFVLHIVQISKKDAQFDNKSEIKHQKVFHCFGCSLIWNILNLNILKRKYKSDPIMIQSWKWRPPLDFSLSPQLQQSSATNQTSLYLICFNL